MITRFTRFTGPAKLFPSNVHQIELMASLQRSIVDAIRASSAVQLDGDNPVVAKSFVQSYGPQLLWQAKIAWEQQWMEPIGEALRTSPQGFKERLARYIIHVPVYGNPGILACCRPAGPISYPAHVELRNASAGESGDADLVFEYVNGQGADAVKKQFELDRQTISSGFANLVATFEQKRQQVVELACAEVQLRRAALQRLQDEVSSMGIPIRKPRAH